MKNIYKYLMLAIVAVLGLSLTSCKDDETTLSRAVLASLDVMYFDAVPDPNDDPQIITITSDADWVVDAPEWVFVTPMSGHAGQTDVTINVADNFRDGDIDNPRKATVIFKGRNLWSQAAVVIRQDGDKFRDPTDYSIDDMEAAADETVVRLPNMIVTAVGPEGFICTDGDQYALITEPAIAVEVGKKVSIVGEKWTNSMKFAYVKGERMTDEGTAAVPAKTPVDITATLDKTNGKKYQYVSVTGVYDGAAISVEDNNCKAYMINVNDNLGINKLAGHILKVTGYFAGQATPVVNIIPTEIEDLGVDEVLFLYDDFEWLTPWAVAGGAGDQVGKFNSGETCPQLQNCVVDGISAYDAIQDKGYTFLYMGSDMKSSKKKSAKDCTYLQTGDKGTYVKFGKTGYYAGIMLPKLENVTAGDNCILTFDWVPMCSGAQNFDDTLLTVIIETGTDVNQIDIPGDNLVDKEKMEWQHATVDLTGIKITPETRISIRNVDNCWPLEGEYGKTGLVRYFLDNIKVALKKD